ncbi:hypothetical protein KUCAC02_003312 [Chaenocephalus aceratus]|uniref:Uncharacterized protein n=1 Tax=Chaenocephalus aceratus TaxID=36190 RepID=A0ACB9WLC7_CHAAC|nr:hypothetical protein KUCAC02_003312 [Chaenocephalus aceratus]
MESRMVLKKDIVTTNGVIHLIDQVLIPNSAKEGLELMGDSQSTFSDMVSELGLASALGPKNRSTHSLLQSTLPSLLR